MDRKDKEEYELICNKLAEARDKYLNIEWLDKQDAYALGEVVGSPYCVLCYLLDYFTEENNNTLQMLYKILSLTPEYNNCYNKNKCIFCFKKCEYREISKLIDKLESWQK